MTKKQKKQKEPVKVEDEPAYKREFCPNRKTCDCKSIKKIWHDSSKIEESAHSKKCKMREIRKKEALDKEANKLKDRSYKLVFEDKIAEMRHKKEHPRTDILAVETQKLEMLKQSSVSDFISKIRHLQDEGITLIEKRYFAKENDIKESLKIYKDLGAELKMDQIVNVCTATTFVLIENFEEVGIVSIHEPIYYNGAGIIFSMAIKQTIVDKERIYKTIINELEKLYPEVIRDELFERPY